MGVWPSHGRNTSVITLHLFSRDLLWYDNAFQLIMFIELHPNVIIEALFTSRNQARITIHGPGPNTTQILFARRYLPVIELTDSAASKTSHTSENDRSADLFSCSQNEDLYDHRWFRKLLLFVYCLGLAKAALILCIFPVAGALKTLQTTGSFFIKPLGILLAVDICMIWGFALAGVCSLQNDAMPPYAIAQNATRRILHIIDQLKGRIPSSAWAWVIAIAWNTPILALTAVSAWVGFVSIW